MEDESMAAFNRASFTHSTSTYNELSSTARIIEPDHQHAATVPVLVCDGDGDHDGGASTYRQRLLQAQILDSEVAAAHQQQQHQPEDLEALDSFGDLILTGDCGKGAHVNEDFASFSFTGNSIRSNETNETLQEIDKTIASLIQWQRMRKAQDNSDSVLPPFPETDDIISSAASTDIDIETHLMTLIRGHGEKYARDMEAVVAKLRSVKQSAEGLEALLMAPKVGALSTASTSAIGCNHDSTDSNGNASDHSITAVSALHSTVFLKLSGNHHDIALGNDALDKHAENYKIRQIEAEAREESADVIDGIQETMISEASNCQGKMLDLEDQMRQYADDIDAILGLAGTGK